MTEAEQPAIRAHEDPDLFREALNFTAAETFLPVRLIEKDYFCTILLKYLVSSGGQLIFKARRSISGPSTTPR